MAAGHHPYVFPGGPPAAEPTVEGEHRAYLECLSYIDERLRQLVEGLAARGLGDTLVAIVSDHGEGFAQHGVRAHGNQVYDEALRVPMVLAGPQLAGLNARVTFPTMHPDLAPTLLGLLGVEVPMTMKGRDLTKDAGARLAIMGARPPAEQLGVRDGKWKMVASLESGVTQLFDLTADPGETRDVYQEHAELAQGMLTRARQWQVHARNLIENYASILEKHGHRCGDRP
jgi:arylsulfatase A-like enzyme